MSTHAKALGLPLGGEPGSTALLQALVGHVAFPLVRIPHVEALIGEYSACPTLQFPARQNTELCVVHGSPDTLMEVARLGEGEPRFTWSLPGGFVRGARTFPPHPRGVTGIYFKTPMMVVDPSDENCVYFTWESALWRASPKHGWHVVHEPEGDHWRYHFRPKCNGDVLVFSRRDGGGCTSMFLLRRVVGAEGLTTVRYVSVPVPGTVYFAVSGAIWGDSKNASDDKDRETDLICLDIDYGIKRLHFDEDGTVVQTGSPIPFIRHDSLSYTFTRIPGTPFVLLAHGRRRLLALNMDTGWWKEAAVFASDFYLFTLDGQGGVLVDLYDGSAVLRVPLPPDVLPPPRCAPACHCATALRTEP